MKHRTTITAALLGAVFFLISWFLWSDAHHFIDGGDVFFPIDQVLLLSKIQHLWYPDQLGGVVYDVSVVPLRSIFALLQVLHVSSVNIERLFLAFGYAVSTVGMYLLARRFWRERCWPIVAAIWYPCSISYCLAIPNENNVVALAVLPLLILFALNALDDLIYVVPFTVVSALLGFVASNPPTVALIAAMVALFGAIGAYQRANPRRVLVTSGWLLLGGAIANFWWVIAATNALRGNAMVAAGVTDLTWALRRTNLVSVLEQTAFWGFGFGADPWRTLGQWYENNPIPHTALVLTPVLALSLLWFQSFTRERRVRSAALVAACVAAMLLAKGEADPFSGINAWLYGHVPGMFLFREPVKFLFIPALGLPLLAAAAFYEFSARLPRLAVYALAALFLCVPLATGWALLSGWAFALSESQARISIPSYWYDAAHFLNDRNADHERVLLLPEDGFYQAHYVWGLNGVDRIAETSFSAPVVRLVADQYTYFQNSYGSGALRLLDRALRAQRPDWLRNEFDRLAIGYVVLRTDVVPDARTMSFAEAREDLQLLNARVVGRFGPLAVYQVPAAPRIVSPDFFLRSCASPAAELQLGMRLPPNISVIRSYTAACRRSSAFLQPLRAKATLAPTGAVVVHEMLDEQSRELKLHPQTVAVPAHVRIAGDGDMRTARAASFCGPWVYKFTKDGWTAHRCVAVGGASYIRISAPPFKATHYPASMEFRWLPTGDRFSAPLDVVLSVPHGVRYAQVSLIPGPLTTGLSSIRAAAQPMRIASVLPYTNISASKHLVYQVERPLQNGLMLDGVEGGVELLYRLPGGRRFSVFSSSDAPASLDVLKVFERAYQASPFSSVPTLRLNRVTFEEAVLPFRTVPVIPLSSVTLKLPGTRWHIERLSRPRIVTPLPGANVYIGEPLHADAAGITYSSGPWWTHMNVTARQAGWIAMRQAYSNDWAMPGSTAHATIDGYANAWYVPRAGTYPIFIGLEPLQHWLYAAAAALTLLLFATVLLIRRRDHEAA